MKITLTPITDPQSLKSRWRKLEAASYGGFFKSWSYQGTLLPHFADPHLLAVRDQDQDIALGLFSLRRTWTGRRLSLHEAGMQPWDGLFVEHNGLLLRPGAAACLPAALATAAQHGRIILSGIDDAHLHAARQAGQLTGRLTRHAPAIDLAALTASGRPLLDGLSANARAQIRRALRLYGPALEITAARGLAEARAFFDCLVALHQASWTARGKPGAFAAPPLRALHTQLIEAALPQGEVALLRIRAGTRELGYLYQFQHSGRVMNYQAGLVTESDARLKPGLICHVLAIELARSAGARVYDFLAGEARYKTTLVPRHAAAGEDLHWGVLDRPHSLLGRWAAMTDGAVKRKQSFFGKKDQKTFVP